jgi:hypothetical protein
MDTNPGPGRRSTRKPFQPAPGRDIQIESVPTIEAKTKGFFLRALVSAALVSLSVTGVYGLVYRQFGPLQSVWIVVGPVMGAMINHYVGTHRRDL